MFRRRVSLIVPVFGLGCFTAIVSLASCNGSVETQIASGGSAAGGSAGGGAAGAGNASGFGGDITNPCYGHCSDDLQKVLDCDGDPVPGGECKPDEGCYDAKCIADPCKVAQLTKSSYGCDFWAVKTGLLEEAKGACFAAFIANTWSTPVKIRVEYDGMELPVDFAYVPQGQGASITYEPYDKANGLPVGGAAVLFLSRDPSGLLLDCPKPAAIAGETGVINTGRGKAFHITTDRPVTAYQMLPYGHGGGAAAVTSATLLLPVGAWDDNYLVISAGRNATINSQASPLIDIVATEDDTVVAMLPSADIIGAADVDPGKKNTKVKYTLKKGEVLQIEQPAELSGSPILANKPIGLWGGHSCLYSPLDEGSCDSAQQQLPPVNALGDEYAAVPPRGRGGVADEAVPYRLAGAVNKTNLTWQPQKPDGAPDTVMLGDVVDFVAAGPFVVKSQDASHPFYLSQSMTGGEAFDSEGDPDWVNFISPKQFLDHHIFFTAPTFSEASLVVVRTKPILKDGSYDLAGKFEDVTLDCAGPLTGWAPVGTSKTFEFTRVDLVTGDFQGVNGCSNGWHEMASKRPFGATVWGWGSKAAQGADTTLVSYAYPTGAKVQPVNDVLIPADPQ